MKKYWLLVPLLIVAVVLGALPGCSSGENGMSIPSPLSIAQDIGSGSLIWSQQSVGLWVSGDGKVTAAPDIALLSLGVEAQEVSVTEAQRKAAEAMDKVMKALKAKGIADKDIQTQNFNVSPVYQWLEKENQKRNEIIAYRVANTIVAKIRQIDKAGSIIDDVAAAAGDLTRINNIDFTVDDPTPFYKEARAKAVAYAVNKAKQMADAAGIRLGRLIYMTENVQYGTPMVRNYLKSDSAMGAASAPTQISAGELDFQTTVQLVYEMR